METNNLKISVLPFLEFLKRPTEIETRVKTWMNMKRPHLQKIWKESLKYDFETAVGSSICLVLLDEIGNLRK